MTIAELKILLDLHLDSKKNVLKEHAREFDLGYFFVDSDTGKCYLFDRNGNENDISKVKKITEEMIDINLTKIVIPNYVMSIGRRAFYGCGGLTSVMIGNGITHIGDLAFSDCNKLMSMTIPNNVKWIGDEAFYGCGRLMSVTIGKNVTSIGNYAFYECSGLTSMTIGSSVTSIGNWAFFGCINLKSLIFKGKTLNEVKDMYYYPWGINYKSIIKYET